jgi:hypothetical protein
VYRVKAFVYGFFVLIFGADWLGVTMLLGVIWGTLVVVFHMSVLWGALWLLRWGVRGVYWWLTRVVRGREKVRAHGAL